MSPATIRRRLTKDGERRYIVSYRRGGRGYRVEYAGTFRSERDAKIRRDLVAGWLAQGLDPRVELARLAETPAAPRTFAQAHAAMVGTRHDAADETLRMKKKSLDKVRALRPDLVDKPAEQWTVGDVQELVAAMVAARLAPSTVKKYLGDVKLVLEHVGVDPNPARDRRVKLPAQVRAETSPPSAAEVVAILERVLDRHRLPLIVLEQTAMRVGELGLPWDDVDLAGCRFRLSRERTKTRHPRWVQVPEWLMVYIDEICPLEDRTMGRSVFATSEAALRNAMRRACQAAGIPLYSPHDLRHRRASLWHGQGVTIRDLMERGGWTRSELPVDVYTHVMPLDEVPQASLERLLVRTR